MKIETRTSSYKVYYCKGRALPIEVKKTKVGRGQNYGAQDKTNFHGDSLVINRSGLLLFNEKELVMATTPVIRIY